MSTLEILTFSMGTTRSDSSRIPVGSELIKDVRIPPRISAICISLAIYVQVVAWSAYLSAVCLAGNMAPSHYLEAGNSGGCWYSFAPAPVRT